MERLSVITWDTDRIGKMAIRAVLDDPRLDLAGVYTDSEDDKGTDAGDLCGRPRCGVLATGDVDALLALGADSVVYTSPHAELSHVTRLLENGQDVISTNPFHNLGGLQGTVREQILAACARGNSSLHLSGLSPGWIDSVAALTTAICRKVDRITITESADCSHYESLETWNSVGMGLSEATPETFETARSFFGPFHDTIERIADMLGVRLDDVEFSLEYATASERIDLGWFAMEKDTHAALRAGWNGKVNGRTVVANRMVWYLTRQLNEGWEFSDDIYQVAIEGEPSIDTRIRIDMPTHWTGAELATPTAMPAVNNLFQVKAAPAGILSISNAGLPHALAGIAEK